MTDERPAGADERLAAEQDERRRLAELIHDGPVQHIAAIAQMLDAASHALAAGDAATAATVVDRALAVTREASGELRELVTGLEPPSLDGSGFAAALRELASRVCGTRGIACELALTDVDELGEEARVGLYQLVRESLDHAVRRGPPSRVRVALDPTPAGGVELVVHDDGSTERRSAVLDGLAERAASLNARFEVTRRRGEGTSVRVTVPPSAARR